MSFWSTFKGWELEILAYDNDVQFCAILHQFQIQTHQKLSQMNAVLKKAFHQVWMMHQLQPSWKEAMIEYVILLLPLT